MYRGNDPRCNGSGYLEIPAYKAIQNVTKEEQQEKARLDKFLGTIFCIASLAGYEIENRLIIKDKKTGKTWR